ncbi:MAG: DNA adenine methylase [Segetibacter sp.]|nr:DNA adenine methylase [Segetibacter sp.]
MNIATQTSVWENPKKIRPIIKWTGGKFDEFSMFSKYIPPFTNYFEPFFGGGGVFFALQPQTRAFINDKSKDLIKFYSLIHSASFKQELLAYANAWDEADKLSVEYIPVLLPLLQSFISGKTSEGEIKENVQQLLAGTTFNQHCLLFEEAFIVNRATFIKKLSASIIDKCRRIKAICFKEDRSFNNDELKDHIETGIKSGLYLFLRELTNLQFAGKLKMSNEKAAANWYFVREFCYASMFRYNSKGEFNIPYGGIAYNKKNFRLKVENIFSDRIQALFNNTIFYNLDFEEFLQQAKPGEEDFIFLDPPYDSEFSEYDQNAFTRKDQVRLRDALLTTTAKWMLVIKETDFIRSLYSAPQCRFIEFDKTYTYNVRGRNNRETRHLIIVNYDV